MKEEKMKIKLINLIFDGYIIKSEFYQFREVKNLIGMIFDIPSYYKVELEKTKYFKKVNNVKEAIKGENID